MRRRFREAFETASMSLNEKYTLRIKVSSAELEFSDEKPNAFATETCEAKSRTSFSLFAS